MPPANTCGVWTPTKDKYQQSNGESATQIGSQIPRTSPRTFTWSAEIDREIWRNVSLKVSYLDSQTRNLFVVEPLIDAAAGLFVPCSCKYWRRTLPARRSYPARPAV